MTQIDKPGVYNLSAEEYHADPCQAPSLSASIAKLLVTRTPLHVWWEHPRLNPNPPDEEDEKKFDIGSAAHTALLNDNRALCIIDAKDWRKDSTKAERAAARAAGKLPLLTEQWERVQAMVASARAQLANHREASDAFTNGKPEQTMIWQEDGLWCRARLDWRPAKVNIFDDYKTTECADPDAFQRVIINVGHDVQAAFYLRGIRALKLTNNPKFRWVVQEPDAPHALSVIAPSPAMLDLADRKVEKALGLWRHCTVTGKWHGYPDRTCYVDAPAYHEAQYLDREVRDDEANKRAIAAFAP